MIERRELERMPTIYYLGVLERKTNDLIGYLADITAKGAMIMCEKPLSTGTTYQLRIEPCSLSSSTRAIEFDARCIWNGPDMNVEFYNCGFEFIKIDPKDIQEIKVLVNKFGINE